MNLWFQPYIKHILSLLTMLVVVILSNYAIRSSISPVTSTGDFVMNTLVIIVFLILSSLLSGAILEIISRRCPMRLNAFFEKYLIIFLIVGVILIGIILNLIYGMFNPITVNSLKTIPLLRNIISFLGF